MLKSLPSAALPHGKIATFGQRAAAIAFDSFIGGLFNIFALTLLGRTQRGWMIYTFAVSPLFWLYEIGSHARWGKTVGKWLIRIRVVDLRGRKISWPRSLLRYSLSLATGLVMLLFNYSMIKAVPPDIFRYFGRNLPQFAEIFFFHRGRTFLVMAAVSLRVITLVEVFSVLLNSQNRSFHDLIAGTVVVKSPNHSPRAGFLRSTEDRSLLSFLLLVPLFYLFGGDPLKSKKEYFSGGGLKAESQESGKTGRKLVFYWEAGGPHYVFEIDRVPKKEGRKGIRKSWKRWDQKGNLEAESSVEE